MLTIKCVTCGHLKIFHHKDSQQVSEDKNLNCSKESLSGCHFTIMEEGVSGIFECNCEEMY